MIYKDSSLVLVNGRIKARHAEQLEDMHLMLVDNEIPHLRGASNILPDRIDSVFFKFSAYFPVEPSMLEGNRMGRIYVTTQSGIWYNPQFKISSGEPSKWDGGIMKRKLTSQTKRLKGDEDTNVRLLP